MSIEKTVVLAAKLLGISAEEAKLYSSDTEYPDLTYYSMPVKGGDSLLVSDQGEVLYANSSISYEKHLREFQNGTRTPIEAFYKHDS